MTPPVTQWEASVADLWERFGSFELAGMYDSMGFETEAGAEYERALELASTQPGMRSAPSSTDQPCERSMRGLCRLMRI